MSAASACTRRRSPPLPWARHVLQSARRFPARSEVACRRRGPTPAPTPHLCTHCRLWAGPRRHTQRSGRPPHVDSHRPACPPLPRTSSKGELLYLPAIAATSRMWPARRRVSLSRLRGCGPAQTDHNTGRGPAHGQRESRMRGGREARRVCPRSVRQTLIYAAPNATQPQSIRDGISGRGREGSDGPAM